MANDDSTLPAGAAVAKPTGSERYVLVSKLGEGAMGVVWSARDTALDRDVAIKLLSDRFLGGDHQARLANEARAMARLAHPNVVAVYDVGERDGRTFVAMELVRGTTFARWLETPRSWREIVDVVRGAALGLAAAHAAGIVHRDVKPTNILVGDDGRARVADFGVAHAAAAAPPPGADVVATTAGLVGSPAYMSIEQLCGEPSDTRADQFGLCITLYEALHGKRPWSANTISSMIVEIARGVPPPIKPVPQWLHRVAERGLAAAPSQRFASMAALARALDGPRRRAPLAIVGAAIAVGVAATAVALIATRGTAAPSGDAPAIVVTTARDAASAPPPAVPPTDAAADAAVDAPAPAVAVPTSPPSRVRAIADAAVDAPLERADARARFFELDKAIRAAEDARDWKTSRELAIRVVPIYIAADMVTDRDPRVGIVFASCKLGDEKTARAYFVKIPRLNQFSRSERRHVAELCERAGVNIADLLNPDDL